MRTRPATLVCALVFLAGSALGQSPPAGGREGPGVSAERRLSQLLSGITLSAAQRATIDSITARYRAQMPALTPGTTPDSATLQRLRELYGNQDEEIRALLTPDQQQIWDANKAMTAAVQTQIPNFRHVIVIVQENRTPDNLFQGLCTPPFGSSLRCSTTPNPKQYDIQTSNWRDRHSPTGVIQPTPIPLANTYDLDHSHKAFQRMCDLGASGCLMDGASDVGCGPRPNCPLKPQFKFVVNAGLILNPYLQLATEYGWANYMFQTNQGPSFPAHQYLFGGTSAPSAKDDSAGIFAAENMASTGIGGTAAIAGCIADSTTRVALISPPGVEKDSVYPCFEHQTMGDLLHGAITWRYYAPSAGSIWTAPDAIQHICQSTGPNGQCVGPAWKEHVDLKPPDVLTDIDSCRLRSVSWVIPNGLYSDHAHGNTGGGPSWVAAIVNAIGTNSRCDNNTGYWKNTAIFITWDDWGGWYDHVPPTLLKQPQGDYEYGFRVPLLVVSAYTPRGYINNVRHDFGSILRFIEHNFSIPEGALTFSDQRSQTNLIGFFDLTHPPRDFTRIGAPLNASFFLHDKRRPTPPDDE